MFDLEANYDTKYANFDFEITNNDLSPNEIKLFQH